MHFTQLPLIKGSSINGHGYQTKKLILVQYCELNRRLYLDFASFSTYVLFVAVVIFPGFSLESHIAFSCCVLLVSLGL